MTMAGPAFRLRFLTLLFLLPALAGCASRAERAAKYAESAQSAYNTGNYWQARMDMLNAVQTRDDVASYWVLLGDASMRLQQYAAAFDAYSHALDLEPNNLQALQNLADISLAAQRLDDARKHADKILKLDPQNLRALLVRGHVELRQKRFAPAIVAADRILQSYPLEDAPLTLKARALFQSGRRQEGIDLIEKVIPIRGATPPMLDTLLEFYGQTADTANYEKTLERYVALAPDNLAMRLRYAGQLYRNGKRAGAEAILLPMLANNEQPEGVADVMIDLGGASPTEQQLRQASANAPPSVTGAIARVALDKGYSDLAMHLVAPYIAGKMSQETAAAAGLFAAAKLAAGKPDEALEVAQRVLAFDQANTRALQVRSEVMLRRHNFDQALNDARVLVRDQPKIGDYRLLLARVYRVKGDAILAESTYRDAYNDIPGNEYVLADYLGFLSRQKRPADAARIARDFTKNNPSSVRGWAMLGTLCRTIGDAQCVAESTKARSRLEMTQDPSPQPA